MSKVIKLEAAEIKKMVEKIVNESQKKKAPMKEAKKPGRVIRLTESEMIEFLDKLASKVENSRRRRTK